VKYPELLIERVYNAVRKHAVISTPNAKHKNPKRYDYFMWLPDEFLRLFGEKNVKMLFCDDYKIFVQLSKEKT